jgi:hypothetical protein
MGSATCIVWNAVTNLARIVRWRIVVPSIFSGWAGQRAIRQAGCDPADQPCQRYRNRHDQRDDNQILQHFSRTEQARRALAVLEAIWPAPLLAISSAWESTLITRLHLRRFPTTYSAGDLTLCSHQRQRHAGHCAGSY